MNDEEVLGRRGIVMFRQHEGKSTYSLQAHFGHVDITEDVESLVRESSIQSGVACVAVVGSTGAITTIEYEPGALADLKAALDRLAPIGPTYEHDARWGDGNGFSHLRSALLKTSLSVPILDGKLALGTWQQLLVLNLDNRAREREVVCVLQGMGS